MFTGKVIIVYLIDASEELSMGLAIVNPQVHDRFGRKFITGTVPHDAEDWASGLGISVALDRVEHFLEFSDEDEYFARSTSAMPSVKGKHVH